MSIKKWIIIIGLVLAAVFLILWINSFSIAMAQVGLLPDKISYSEYLADDDGSLVRIVQSRDVSGKVGLAMLRRNSLGFWSVWDSSLSSERGKTAVAQLAWNRDITAKKYDLADVTAFEVEWHHIFCGDNAVGKVYFLEEQIPRNVAVHVKQAESLYWIHIVSYDTDVADTFQRSMIDLLLENGCISAE